MNSLKLGLAGIALATITGCESLIINSYPPCEPPRPNIVIIEQPPCPPPGVIIIYPAPCPPHCYPRPLPHVPYGYGGLPAPREHQPMRPPRDHHRPHQ